MTLMKRLERRVGEVVRCVIAELPPDLRTLSERVPVFCEWEMAEHWLEEGVADDAMGLSAVLRSTSRPIPTALSRRPSRSSSPNSGITAAKACRPSTKRCASPTSTNSAITSDWTNPNSKRAGCCEALLRIVQFDTVAGLKLEFRCHRAED